MRSDFYEKFAIAIGVIGILVGLGVSLFSGSFLPIVVYGIGVIIWFIMQYAIVSILRNQEVILDLLQREQELKTEPSVPVSNSKLDLRKIAAASDKSDLWICPSCGEKNARSTRNCRGCGQPK